MSLDQHRVVEARQRLRAADESPFRHDPAIRVVSLDSPKADEAPIELHPRVAILAGLSESAQQSLAATIDAIRVRNPDVGLTGMIETHGRRRPMSMLHRLQQAPGAGIEAPGLLISAPEASLYIEVAKSAERAILVSAAELRGADERAAQIDEQRAALQQSLEHASTALATIDDRAAMLAAIDDVLLPVEVVEELQGALEVVVADPKRLELQAALEQAEAAKARVLPGDGAQAALLADLAIAEADGTLASYDVIPDGPAAKLHSQLQRFGLETTADQAPQVAARVIAESRELRDMRHSLQRELSDGTEHVEHAPIDDEDSLLDLRAGVDQLRMQVQRRLRAQQQLLAIARETIAELSGLGDAERAAGDLSPVLIEEPLLDLPGELSGAVLSMLLRYSAHRQVICLSDQRLVETWTRSVGGRAGWTKAHGWFLTRDRGART